MKRGRRIVLRECQCGCTVLLLKDAQGNTVSHVWLLRCDSVEHDYRPEDFIENR